MPANSIDMLVREQSRYRQSVSTVSLPSWSIRRYRVVRREAAGTGKATHAHRSRPARSCDPCRDWHLQVVGIAARWRRCALLPAVHNARSCCLAASLAWRIVFTPNGDGYTFEAPTRFDKLFSGIIAPRPSFIPYGHSRCGAHWTGRYVRRRLRRTAGECFCIKWGCVPNGIRTRVLALKGPRPRPLDDGDTRRANFSPSSYHACNYGDSSGR